MAKMCPRFVASLNLAIMAIDKAKANTNDIKVIRGLQSHINDLVKLRTIVMEVLSNPKFDFESVVRNLVAKGAVQETASHVLKAEYNQS